MRRPLVLLAATALILSACTDEGDGDDGSPRGPTASTAIDVSATEFAFDLPAEVTGGVVEMRFTNIGGLPHEFGFVADRGG